MKKRKHPKSGEQVERDSFMVDALWISNISHQKYSLVKSRTTGHWPTNTRHRQLFSWLMLLQRSYRASLTQKTYSRKTVSHSSRYILTITTKRRDVNWVTTLQHLTRPVTGTWSAVVVDRKGRTTSQPIDEETKNQFGKVGAYGIATIETGCLTKVANVYWRERQPEKKRK